MSFPPGNKIGFWYINVPAYSTTETVSCQYYGLNRGLKSVNYRSVGLNPIKGVFYTRVNIQ